MNHSKITTRLALIAAVGAVVFAGACSSESSKAEVASTDREPARVTRTGADAVVAQSGEATQAYEQLLQTINQLQKDAPETQEGRAQAIARTESLLTKFIAAYPGTMEAYDAKFQLGIMYIQIGRASNAVVHLEEYIDANVPQEPDRMAYASFYLAEAYKASDKFNAAKKQYKVFVDSYPTFNPRFIAAARAGIGEAENMKRLAIGSEPIPFEVKDLEGNALNLTKYKGKVVLIDFWATWCGPCRVEMPNVVRLHKKFKSKGFEIIGISLDYQNQLADLERYIKANDMQWPQHFDGKGWQNGIALKYGVKSIPATYLIDRQGKIRYRSVRGAQLDKAVEKLISETS
ncbi:MAG: redoxin domain-containing protein [bacterium]|nr:redoxin domain-containing protein [bacterium]